MNNGRFGALAETLSAVTGRGVHAVNTGGGSSVLQIPLTDTTTLLAAANRTVFLPVDEEGPWWLWRHDNTKTYDTDQVLGTHLNRQQLIDLVREHAH
jgi:CO/xanthine dehydrogenase FAD-binding subunit